MEFENRTWDYVVVGAGSSGCVLANRLRESSSTTVLGLEAGPPASLLMKPAGAGW